MEIINERPQGMSYSDYRIARKESQKQLKEHKKGIMVHVSVNPTWEMKTGIKDRRTFRGKCDKEKEAKILSRISKVPLVKAA